jgi:hypothetical protein
MNQKLQYTGTYKVMQLFRISRRRKVLRRDLTLEEAKRVVNSYPNSSRSMVFFIKQFTANKYYKSI